MRFETPFTTFHFLVYFHVAGVSGHICAGAFSECDGLEMTMEPKTIREGGNNAQPIHLLGPVSYGTLTLRRGMTSNIDLWRWFEQVQTRHHSDLRADGKVVLLDADGKMATAVFRLTRCLPVKVRAPALNALGSAVAIEEMQIAYETLQIEAP